MDGDGVLIIGAGPWAAVACRLIRMLGCTMPVEVYHRDDVVPMKWFTGDTEVKAVVDTRPLQIAALRLTRLKRVLCLPEGTYPVASPCRLFAALDRAAVGYWTETGRGGPIDYSKLLIDREAAITLVDVASDEGWPSAFDFNCCSHDVLGSTSKVGSALIHRADGMPRLVDRCGDPTLNAYLPIEQVVQRVYRDVVGP